MDEKFEWLWKLLDKAAERAGHGTEALIEIVNVGNKLLETELALRNCAPSTLRVATDDLAQVPKRTQRVG